MRRFLWWALPLLIILIGIILWWPPSSEADRKSDLGAAMVGGAAVAFAVLLVERTLTNESAKREGRVRLVELLMEKDDLISADLQNQSLPHVYLSGKVLQQANLSGADLREADLSRADLRGAVLKNADLRGAKLRDARLLVTADADLENVDLDGALYSRSTEWPVGIDHNKLKELGAVREDDILGRVLCWAKGFYKQRVTA